MKKVLKWFSWVIFFLFSLQLTSEYSGIGSGDTHLFYLNGQSSYLGPNDFNLSPIIMVVIYIALLIFIVVAIIHKKSYQALSIANFVLSVPVMLVYIYYAQFYPPFGESECFDGAQFFYLLYIYLSAVLFIFFIGYYICLFIWRFAKRKQSLS